MSNTPELSLTNSRALRETERTLLRAFAPGDAPDLFAYLSLIETYRFEPGEPISLAQASDLALERSRGENFVAVVGKESGRLIGHFSVFRADPEFVNTYEIGFIFNPEYQGKGFATEAGLALIDYLFVDRAAHKLVANCSPANEKSNALLRRLGLSLEGRLIKNIYFRERDGRPDWQDTNVYGLVNPEE
jgi:RimJ/RimL family protein N-acetyltransferase